MKPMLLAFGLGLALGAESRAAELDWAKLAAPDVVQVITVDPDGDVRETKVWIVARDGSGWLRTSDSRWLANLRRDPNLKLRSGADVVELSANEVEVAALRAEVDREMRAKYGWPDRVLGWFRWRTPNVLRLAARGD